MKSAIDVVEGKIVDYDEKAGELVIRAKYDDYLTMTKRGYSKCRIQLVDSRNLSCKQRNSCYALIREIADYSGMSEERTKEILKVKFLAEVCKDTADNMFSLSDAPMSLICSFQRFLARMIVEWDIPCSIPLYSYVDDISDYVYACIINKKCVVCGQHADLHHIDRVGAGRNRDEIVHLGMEAMPLCRKHHEECHQIGEREWREKYHIDGGIVIDQTIAKIYKLNTKNRKDK